MAEDLTAAALALFEALPDRAIVFDVLGHEDLRVVGGNRLAALALGHTVEELPGLLGSAMYPPEDLADVLERARTTLRDGRPFHYRAVRERPQGRVVVDAMMVPVGPDRIVSHGRDVSELVEARRRLDDLEQLADVGSWHWNAPDDRLEWSAHYRRIVGVTPDEPISMRLALEIVHPEDRARVAGRVSEATSGGEFITEATYRIVRPDGVVRTVRGRGSRVRDDNGGTLRMYGTIQDVTELERAAQDRRRLDEAMSRHRQALELNDNVVQGLAAAWLAFDLGATDEGVALLRRTTQDAQALISRLLRDGAEDGRLRPGDLARTEAANVEHPVP